MAGKILRYILRITVLLLAVLLLCCSAASFALEFRPITIETEKSLPQTLSALYPRTEAMINSEEYKDLIISLKDTGSCKAKMRDMDSFKDLLRMMKTIEQVESLDRVFLFNVEPNSLDIMSDQFDDYPAYAFSSESISPNIIVRINIPEESRLQLGKENGLEEAKQSMQEMVHWIEEAGIYEGMTDKQKYLQLEKVIRQHIEYEEKEEGQTWTDAVKNGKGVCHDYATITMILCRMIDLPCTYLYGHIKKNGALHAWNKLILDGDVYYSDVTWDDGGNPGMRLKKEFKDREIMGEYTTLEFAF